MKGEAIVIYPLVKNILDGWMKPTDYLFWEQGECSVCLDLISINLDIPLAALQGELYSHTFKDS